MVKAVSLLSGGLDSALAAKLLVDQGLEVLGLHFSSPFTCNTNVEKVAREIGIPLSVVEKGAGYLSLLKNPKYGYGKNMNPCIDCRIFMFTLATSFLKDSGAAFIATGEVLGQRPMSQQRTAMKIIDRDSGMEGLILRPLSAKLMKPTIPEIEGWVDREKLLGIFGRGRKTQLELARRYGLTAYAAPGGGCLLTDRIFSEKVRDLMNHSDTPSMEDAAMLRLGRHFRISNNLKLIVGRDPEENEKLESMATPGRIAFKPVGMEGPVGLACGTASEQEIREMLGILMNYYKSYSLPFSVEYNDGTRRQLVKYEEPPPVVDLTILKI